jgi:tRNA 2-thiouridine synthesizing protein E
MNNSSQLSKGDISRNACSWHLFLKEAATMETITVNEVNLELDGNGFLADPEAWSPDVANYIAAVEGINMTEHHWEVVHFLRDYYRQFRTAPSVKVLVKEIARKIGSEQANTKYLYKLYPCGPATQACKIAGLPRSTGCV